MRRYRESPSSQRRSVIGLKVRIPASEETETEVLIPRPGPTPCEALDSRIVFLPATGTRWARPCTTQERRPTAVEGPEKTQARWVTRESGAIDQLHGNLAGL